MSDSLYPTPPGWPRQVVPPGVPRWEESASRWLLDNVPGEWRQVELYRTHPLLLARDARYHVEGALQGHRDGYARARVDVANIGDITTQQQRQDGGHLDLTCVPELPSTVLGEYLDAYAREGARLLALCRQIRFIQDALEGVRWVPKSMPFQQG